MMPILEELDYYVWLLTRLILSLRMFHFPYASFMHYCGLHNKHIQFQGATQKHPRTGWRE